MLERAEKEYYSESGITEQTVNELKDMCADKLSDISSASRTNITYIGILAGVFFILNGIVLIIVAKNISVSTVKP